MSGNQNQDSQNLFSVYKQVTDKILGNIKQSVPQFHQSITNLQQECLQSYEDSVNTAIEIQKEYANRNEYKPIVSAEILKTINNITEEFVKMSSIQTQTALVTINGMQQNIKSMHDNATLFSELNRNFILPWSTMFFKKN